MLQKDYVNAYLTANFERIQDLRILNGFSWKPFVKEILELHPDIGLDPDNENHRDRLRCKFLNIRKKAKAVNVVPERFKFRVEDGVGPDNTLKTEVHWTKPRIVGAVEVAEFRYTDTYNQKTSPILTEADEFLQWKREKDRVRNQQGMHIVVGCMHLPAINKQFFKAFEEFLTDAHDVLKGIHLIGDILDCKALSSHDNGQVSDGTLEEEYNEANKYLDRIDATLRPGIEKNYLWGNHEQRYERLLKKVDMSKFGGALLSPTKGCHFAERGYTIQEDYNNGKILLGKHLDLIHGQYITQNPSKKHLDTYKKSIMFAHTHKMGSYFDCDKAAFNIGWMGDQENSAFNYCSRITKSQWQNGFAVVLIDEHGYYHVQLVQWYNGRFVFGTKEYKG